MVRYRAHVLRNIVIDGSESGRRGRGATHPKLNARTGGFYQRAGPEDLSILDVLDDRRRAELIGERLRLWKSIANA